MLLLWLSAAGKMGELYLWVFLGRAPCAFALHNTSHWEFFYTASEYFWAMQAGETKY